MTDIVARLRDMGFDITGEAADEIDRLRALLREWRNHWPCSPELRARIDAALKASQDDR